MALAAKENEMDCLMNLTFKNPKLEGLKFGDIYLTAMKEAVGDFSASVEESSKILNMTGKVLPVTLDQIKICAELEDGTVKKQIFHLNKTRLILKNNSNLNLYKNK